MASDKEKRVDAGPEDATGGFQEDTYPGVRALPLPYTPTQQPTGPTNTGNFGIGNPGYDAQYAEGASVYVVQPGVGAPSYGAQTGAVGQYFQQGVHPMTVIQNPSDEPINQTGLLVFSILMCLCCCWPAGVVAICYAVSRGKHLDQGNMEAARDCARKSIIWSVISLALGVISIIITVVVNLINLQRSEYREN